MQSPSAASLELKRLERALYDLASVPMSDDRWRISTDLTSCYAQTACQKRIARCTCQALYSRARYDKKTDLLVVSQNLKRALFCIMSQPGYPSKPDLPDACFKATQIFDQVLTTCSHYRKDTLTHLKVDIAAIQRDIQIKRNSLGSPQFERRPDGSINYEELLKENAPAPLEEKEE